jgi:hypothetical protein
MRRYYTTNDKILVTPSRNQVFPPQTNIGGQISIQISANSTAVIQKTWFLGFHYPKFNPGSTGQPRDGR